MWLLGQRRYRQESLSLICIDRHLQVTSATVDPFEDILDFIEAPETAALSDELTAYLEADRECVSDVLEWWKKKQAVFPQLSRMAMDYHCIPGDFFIFIRSIHGSQTLALSVDVE
jgi:hypothetical protein